MNRPRIEPGGLSAGDLERVRAGSGAEGWTARQALLLQPEERRR